jgi:single-strand DNA-binding protein
MNESMVTFQGWLGGDVRTQQAGSATVARFRVASTPRRLNRSTGEWHDGPTQWYSVSAWRALGEHCATSLRRGDPVVVHGRLTQSSWVNQEGVEMTSLEVDASFVGHDLNRGTSDFTRGGGRPTGEAATAAVASVTAAPAPATDDRSADPIEPHDWVA